MHATQRHPVVALCRIAWIAGAAIAALGCATVPRLPASDSIDYQDARGQRGTFGGSRGRVIILDVCASWATACNLNARVLDEVQLALAGEAVDVVTMLMDEGTLGQVAMVSYVQTLGVKHPVVLAGSRVRAGTSALGDTGYVPRVVVIDADGAIRLDDSGGVVNVQYIVDHVRPLLPPPSRRLSAPGPRR